LDYIGLDSSNIDSITSSIDFDICSVSDAFYSIESVADNINYPDPI